MADIKQIHSRTTNTTYNIKDEVARQQVATKQDAISNVSVDYQEDGGSPDASVAFSEGSLNFSMKNMKMKFSELTAEEKAQLKGDKGDPGDSVIVGEGDLPLAHVLGDDNTKAMSQKGVTDAIYDATSAMTVLTPDVTGSAYKISLDNKWTSVGDGKAGRYLNIVPGRTYIISTDYETVYAWLTTDEVVYGHEVSYCEGTGRTYLSSGSIEMKAPNDAVMFYLLEENAAGQVLGSQITEAYQVLDQVADLREDLETTSAELEIEMDELHESMAVKNTIGIDFMTRYAINASTGKWYDPQSTMRGAILTISPNTKYELTTSMTTYYAWLTASPVIVKGGTPPYCAGYEGRISLEAGSTEAISPSDAHALYVLKVTSGGDTGLTVQSVMGISEGLEQERTRAMLAEEKLSRSIDGASSSADRKIANAIGNALTPLTHSLDEDGWELPTSKEQVIVSKRAKQMLNIKWTPKHDLPYKRDSIDEHSRAAGVEQTGFPYSSVKELDKFIGIDVSIHTFMTAINNPYSLLYTEDVRSNGTSAWGKTYHGNNCDMYYGVVCSALTAYATCQDPMYPTEMQPWVYKYDFSTVRLYHQTAQSLRLGDIWLNSGHNRLIVGIRRDENGDVIRASEIEAIGLHARTNSESASALDNSLRVNGGDVILTRNIELYKVFYEQSPYVAVDDEVQPLVTYNNDICTFAGDKATFREGELVVLNYNLDGQHGGWTAIEVYKDDEMVGLYEISQIDQSSLPQGQQYHALKLEELEAGMYKARMTNGTSSSEFTEWEMLRTDVDAALANGTYHITFDSNGKAMSMTVCEIDGERYVVKGFDDDDRANGYIDIDLSALQAAQTPNKSMGGKSLYIKVHFEGQYGRVTNEYLPLEQ